MYKAFHKGLHWFPCTLLTFIRHFIHPEAVLARVPPMSSPPKGRGRPRLTLDDKGKALELRSALAEYLTTPNKIDYGDQQTGFAKDGSKKAPALDKKAMLRHKEPSIEIQFGVIMVAVLHVMGVVMVV